MHPDVVLLERAVPDPVSEMPGDVDDPAGLDRRRMLRLGTVTALAIGLHNLPEGFVTFAGTLQDPSVGLALAVAMAVHNVPEGVAVAVPVRQATGSRRKAFAWAAFTGIAEPLGALIGWLLLGPFLTPALVAAVFAAVAGVMVTVSIGADGALGIMVGADPDVGVVVMQVDAGSAAEQIGLVEGDVILEIEGRPVGDDASRMSRLVNDHNVGDRITVQWRTADGEVREAEAVLQPALVN